ncbi:hypothetical protein GCM10023190_14300 [Enteractinococcus fodinae]|uniref:Cardiolipin synthase N-terminal domain-containing protein n=1 Tax=Enteractinococcus fodinae TaxID=684663 RepID=A0ABU2AXM9_9MICC|nr:hypothetical protein [Enteractinococcus fodinae]MDR7346095.1 hypothetical protein [Enteractinococcus fodinae]
MVGVAAVLVLLLFIGATGAALSDDPDFTLGTWLVSILVLTPILGAPGALGWFLLRRYPRRS